MIDERQPWLSDPESYCWCDSCIRMREEDKEIENV